MLFLPIPCFKYLFPFLHSQSVCVFQAKMGLLVFRILLDLVFIIDPSILYLLIGEFNPLMFGIIIDRWGLIIIILLIVFWLFCTSSIPCFLSCYLCVLMFFLSMCFDFFVVFFSVITTGFSLLVAIRLT